MARARERGRRFAVDEYSNPQNLTLSRASEYAHRGPETICALQSAGRLYALPDPDCTGSWRYPQWQFNAPSSRLACVLQMFSKCNRWVLHSFMLCRREALHGRSPAEVILDEAIDIQQVLDLASIELNGEQGAA